MDTVVDWLHDLRLFRNFTSPFLLNSSLAVTLVCVKLSGMQSEFGTGLFP